MKAGQRGLACRKCGRPLTLLDVDTQRWYCYKDDEIFHAKEGRWQEHIKPSTPTAAELDEAKRRFRANLKGPMGIHNDKKIDKYIMKAESKGPMPERIVLELEIMQEGIEGGHFLGGFIGGGIIGSAIMGTVDSVRESKKVVPLLGPLNSRQETLTNERLKIRKTWKDDAKVIVALLILIILASD